MGISTHVLDTERGSPAAAIPVRLDRWDGAAWQELVNTITDKDGRCARLVGEGEQAGPGRYRISFEVGAYFARYGTAGLYPHVEITFDVRDERHHHIPLLLAANGYTTYRGT